MRDEPFRALGLMSGTSLDGIDVALIETDGINEVEPLGFASYAYDNNIKNQIRACFRADATRDQAEVREAEKALTLLHAEAVKKFLIENLLEPSAIDLIGFHGQTLFHDPAHRLTLQIGDGSLLARTTGITVINDFRTEDVLAGGQGAPLVPLYHRALATELAKPVAIVNIGGVSNITWIGGEGDDEIMAFDLGPGNALIDDWVLRHTGKPYDQNGRLAASGKADSDVLARFLRHPFFTLKAPKSLDREAFRDFVPDHLSVEDGAATLTLITVWAIVKGIELLPRKPEVIYLTGGGRHNDTIATWLHQLSGIEVDNVDSLGWSGDGLEAEAFAYLAVRSHLGLPITLPATTGAHKPMLGGKEHPVPRRKKT